MHARRPRTQRPRTRQGVPKRETRPTTRKIVPGRESSLCDANSTQQPRPGLLLSTPAPLASRMCTAPESLKRTVLPARLKCTVLYCTLYTV